MKDWFSLAKIRTNKFAHISDTKFRKYLGFAAQNPDIVSVPQVLEKLMILDFVIPYLSKHFRGGPILEIGCGSGVHSALLSHFGTVSATELKSTVSWLGDTVDKTRESVFESLAEAPIDFRYNDGKSIPFDDDSFDLVFHNSVIEHVPDAVSFQEEVGRVLKPGGLCICITGTPALCRFRFIKSHLVRFPLIAGYAFSAVALDKFFSNTRFVRQLRSRIRTWHFEPTSARLQSIIDRHYEGKEKPSSIAARDIRSMYPSLRHFIREPEYNSILMERLAERHSVTPRSLLLQLVSHFENPSNDLIFRMTPSTHSQHTKNYRTEIHEWKVESWVRVFAESGFQVEGLSGYRYQQALDLTFSDRVNAWLTYHALPLVRAASRALPSNYASEIVIVARKPEAHAAN